MNFCGKKEGRKKRVRNREQGTKSKFTRAMLGGIAISQKVQLLLEIPSHEVRALVQVQGLRKFWYFIAWVLARGPMISGQPPNFSDLIPTVTSDANNLCGPCVD